MIFQISPNLCVARDLPQTNRQTVPQTRPCNSKASVTKSVVGSWDCQCPISRRVQRATTTHGDEMNVSSQVGQLVLLASTRNQSMRQQHNKVSDTSIKLWNSLPVQLCNPDITYRLFRRQLKGHLFGNHRHGALWFPICSALEKHLLTYLLTYSPVCGTGQLVPLASASNQSMRLLLLL